MLEPGPFVLWDLSTTLRPSVGYKDNPTLAQDAFRDPGAFLNLELELLLFRLPTDGNTFYALFLAEDRRYWDTHSIDKEQSFITQADYRHEFESRWRMSLTGIHAYTDQVIDLSSADLGAGTARAAGHTLTLRPGVRHDLGSYAWIELDGEATRQFFEEPLNSYWEWLPRLTVGWKLPHDSSISLAAWHLWRPYEDALQLTPTGEALPGTESHLESDRFELRWQQRWDNQKRWTTTLRGFFHQTRDNGLGYSDYDRIGGSVSVQFKSGRWLVKGLARYSRFDYLAQTIAPDEAATRLRHEVTGEVRLEFEVRERLKLIAAGEWDLSDGNVAFDNYEALTGYGGIEWEF